MVAIINECTSMKKDVTYYLLLLQGNGGGNGNPLQYFCLENSRGTEEHGRLQCMGSQSQT